MRKSIHVFVLLLVIFGLVLALAPVSGLHPLRPDTDGDGIPDGWEDEHGLNPNDAGDASIDYNHNGLTNFQEYKNDYDPWDMDSDDDGISNYAESTGLFGFFTDPLAEDTDEDGLSDLQEICRYIDTGNGTQMDEISPDETDRENVRAEIISMRKEYRYKLDPTNSDIDYDGLSDGDEISSGTNPNHVDSDIDGLSDGEEIYVYGTDPMERDTDGDGLLDSEEIFGTYGVVTDPTKEDTDGDGILDGEECLSFGSVPIPPSRHALTYEEFISDNRYANETITVKAKVDRIKHAGGLSNYSILLKPLEPCNITGKRGIVKVDSSWHYDFEHDMMHTDDRFGFNLREGDMIVIVGKAGKFLGSNREIMVDSGGKIYLVLSPEEAGERWLPKKDYVKIIADRKVTSETVTPFLMQAPAQNTTSTPAPTNSSLTPTPNSTSTSSLSPVNVTNETAKTNATAASAPGAKGEGKGIFGLLGYVAIGIVIIVASLFLYTKFGKRIQIRKGQKEGEGDKPPVKMSSMPKGTKKEWS